MTDSAGNELGKAAATAAQEQERARALEAVLAQAPDIGVDEALNRFGAPLSDTERQLIHSLTSEELASLRAAQSKLGALTRDRNNNNNYI